MDHLAIAIILLFSLINFVLFLLFNIQCVVLLELCPVYAYVVYFVLETFSSKPALVYDLFI